jgi:hypothetical protein
VISATIAPIRDDDLPEFCRFLFEHLSRDRSPDAWAKAFTQNWCPDKPNNGFLLRHEQRIVGGIGAIYAVRQIRGRRERFCNITSWCVLDEFRSQSMRLAMALTSQPGLHYTDLTPTQIVSRTLQFLKFRPMDERQAIWPNLPWPLAALAGTRITTDPRQIAEALSPDDARAYEDHRHLPWLAHAALGTREASCYVVWKRTAWKSIQGARILALSDAELFLRRRFAFGSHLLVRHGLLYTRIEARLLPRLPRWCMERTGYRHKVFRSDTLAASDMSNLYTELVALDL